MKKILLNSLACIALLSAAILHAQTAPPAPLPDQLFTAKTIFLANAGYTNNQYTALAYNDLYREFALWNRFQLAAAPASSDLIVELSANGTMVCITIRDVKTNAALWTLNEELDSSHSENGYEKTIDRAAVKVVADLKTLLLNGTDASQAAGVPTSTRPQQGKIK